MIDLFIALIYSILRLFFAYILSLIGSIMIGVAMARNRYIEAFLLPVLDILQSVPILGFFPIVLLLIIKAVPGQLGVELAIVFLIVTSMIWNMIFGVYSSIKSLDPSIYDLIRAYKLNNVITFFHIYVPASIRAIVANSIISWAGGWFFITSSEIIAAGTVEIKVNGIGAYILNAFSNNDIVRVYQGTFVLVLSIIASYILLWNPMFEETGIIKLPSCGIVYNYLRGVIVSAYDHVVILVDLVYQLLKKTRARFPAGTLRLEPKMVSIAFFILVLSLLVTTCCCLEYRFRAIHLPALSNLNIDLVQLVYNISLSLFRVVGVVFISLLISISLSYITYLSMRKDGLISTYIILVGEIFASIPAVLWWPLLSSIVKMGSPGIYIVSLVVFLQGSLWYSFFNIILFGISSMRRDIIELAEVYGIKGSFFIKHIFVPALLPSIVTGALSSWGGAWNATIVAEYFSTGNVKVNLGGMGAFMDIVFVEGSVSNLLIAVLALSIVIAIINKTIWRLFFRKLSGRYMVEY